VNLYSCTAAESLRVYSTLQPPCLDRPVVVCPASSSASQLFGLGLHRGHSIRQLVVAYVTPTVPPRVSFLPAHRVHHCPLFSRSRRIDFSVSPLPPPHIAAAIVLRVPPRGRSAGALSSEAGGVACLPMLVGSANICSTDEVCRSGCGELITPRCCRACERLARRWLRRATVLAGPRHPLPRERGANGGDAAAKCRG
jgi:hypothetical protein